MNQLQVCENKGRQKFKQFLIKAHIKDYHFPNNLQSIYDCEFSTDNTHYIVEIKNRAYKYSNYNDMLLEKAKLTNLKKLASQKNAQILYVHTYDDTSKIKITNITNKEFHFKQQYQQKSHLWNNTKIPKMITYIKDYKEWTN